MNTAASNIRPAASVLVLRDGPRGVELLLIKLGHDSNLLALVGAWTEHAPAGPAAAVEWLAPRRGFMRRR